MRLVKKDPTSLVYKVTLGQIEGQKLSELMIEYMKCEKVLIHTPYCHGAYYIFL